MVGQDFLTISPNKELGSVTFEDNKKISFNEYVKYLKVYYLQFITNVWQFKIDVESNIEYGTTVTIGVNVDNSPITANCHLASFILACEISLDIQTIKNERGEGKTIDFKTIDLEVNSCMKCLDSHLKKKIFLWLGV